MTPDLLRAATGCSAALADRYAVPLADACQRYSINTPARLAAFLAQIGHESGGLQFTREIAGGQAYEGRADLGNTEPGDGPRFRGRALLQVTGRSNYAALSAALGVDFVAEPALLEQPTFAALSAAHWWDAHKCNAFADAGEFDKLSRLINRGNAFASKPANGEADRLARWEKAKSACGVYTSTERVEKSAESEHIPPGEAPDWTPPQKEDPMAPFVIPAVIELAKLIPKLGGMFGGSEVAQRNVAAAGVVVNAVTAAVGAANAQEAVEKIAADPAAREAANKAVEGVWYQISEAGGGGIDGARKADAAQSDGKPWQSPVLWVTVMLVPMVYIALYAVLFREGFSNDIKAMVLGAIFGCLLTGGIQAYFYGTSASSQRKTEMMSK